MAKSKAREDLTQREPDGVYHFVYHIGKKTFYATANVFGHPDMENLKAATADFLGRVEQERARQAAAKNPTSA